MSSGCRHVSDKLPTCRRHLSDKFSAQNLSETWLQTSLRQDKCNGTWALAITTCCIDVSNCSVISGNFTNERNSGNDSDGSVYDTQMLQTGNVLLEPLVAKQLSPSTNQLETVQDADRLFDKWSEISQSVVLVDRCARVRTDCGKSWNLKFTSSRPGKSWNEA